jgi:hypothetical protein
MARKTVPSHGQSVKNWNSKLRSFLAELVQPLKLGFTLIPELSRWSPEFTASGTLAFTPSSGRAYYCHIGPLTFFVMFAVGTTSGVASNAILFTLPVFSKEDLAMWPVLVTLRDPNQISGNGRILANRKQVQVKRYDESNFSIGTVEILAFGVFERLLVTDDINANT